MVMSPCKMYQHSFFLSVFYRVMHHLKKTQINKPISKPKILNNTKTNKEQTNKQSKSNNNNKQNPRNTNRKRKKQSKNQPKPSVTVLAGAWSIWKLPAGNMVLFLPLPHCSHRVVLKRLWSTRALNVLSAWDIRTHFCEPLNAPSHSCVELWVQLP